MTGLGDVRVLECSGHVAAGLCGKLMAGFGALLLRVPAPDGLAGFALDADAHHWFHGGKRECVLDLQRAGDRAAFEDQLRQSDVLIDGWGVDVLAAAGFAADRLRALNPRLIVVQITPFGQTGPQRRHRASDLTLYARAGLMHSTGDGAREPLNARAPIAELSAGMQAFGATMMALMRRGADGLGALVDLSILEAAAQNYEIALTEFTAAGKRARRNNDEHAMVPWRTYPCADGHVAVIGGPIRHWLRAASLFEAPALCAPELATMDQRIAHRAETEALMAPWLHAHDKRTAFHAGQTRGLAWGYLATLADALADPQHAARGFFVTRRRADGVDATMPGAPFRAPGLPWSEAPASAVETAAVATPPRATPASADAPLAGLRVLDFTHDWSGPHAARQLADYGAEVIKIEYPRRLDGMRGGFKQRINEHPRFWQLHRGKKSLTLDLAEDAHRRVLDSLVRGADLIIENSRPGVFAAHGYGMARLRELKPDIVLLSMSAFGGDGPYAGYAGYGGSLEAISGMQMLSAYEAGGPGNRVREVDALNGMMGMCAALLALRHRQRSGEGQHVELSQFETTAWFIGEHFAAAARDGRQPTPIGNRDPRYAPQGCYPALGEDRWLVVSARDDREWSALARMIGGDALADDPRFADLDARRRHHDELDALIGAWSISRDAMAAAEALQTAGVAAAWVADAADIAADAQLGARGWWQDVNGLRMPGPSFLIDGVAPTIRHRGPALGADNAALFAQAGEGGHEPDLRPEHLGTAYSPS